jgi:hypothetical protein
MPKHTRRKGTIKTASRRAYTLGLNSTSEIRTSYSRECCVSLIGVVKDTAIPKLTIATEANANSFDRQP